MKIKEVSEKFNIPVTTLRYYEDKGLLDNVTRVNHVREYEDKDVERISLILSLKKMGLTIQEIAMYIHLEDEGECSKEKRLKMLRVQREKQLDEAHHLFQSIDCIDYMICKLKGRC